MFDGECPECKSKRFQAKLTVGASNDPLEQEADRIADEALAAAPHPGVTGTPLRVQRYMGQVTGSAAPASVERVLASPGSPLDPGLQEDVSGRFGHDFSRVRVHSDAAAEQSARDVSANAYTVGHDIVFDSGRFAASTHAGRRLIAHELVHVIQQGFASMEPDPSDEVRQNPSGLGTNRGALLRQRTPLLLQRAPKVQVKDDKPRHAAIDVRDRAPVPPGADS
jgi:hypothetical protein